MQRTKRGEVEHKKANQRLIQINVVDAVYSTIPRDQARFIAPALSYTKTYWREGQRGKEEVEYTEVYFTRKGKENYWFLTGHLRRIVRWCKTHDIKISFTGSRPSTGIETHIREAPRELGDLTLREDQYEAVKKAITSRRGVIKAPTRTGKTIVQFALLKSFKKVNTLMLAHTKDLVNQIADEGKRFGFNVARCHGEVKDLEWSDFDQVVVMTRQTCIKMLADKYIFPSSYFDIIIVDEAHHVTTPTGQYAQILSQLNSPLRFGFTATWPDRVEAQLTLEGYIGPLIGELTIDEAIDKEILVKPKLVFLKAPKLRINKGTNYDDVIKKGITENIERNRLIAHTAKEYIDHGHSVLILVNKIRHGENIRDALREISVRSLYVRGATDAQDRDKIKKALISKRIMCVIATTVWNEGINIPTLNVCINAAGGKSEITTLQSVGRALTKVAGKEHAVIVDIFDPSHYYLVNHFGERITIYCDQGWL